MFGLLRTLWALMVVFGHIFWLSDFGRFAVFGFFILSGYLMTYIMQNTYGYHFNGIKQFSLNRFLRLYPSYWFICFLSIFLVVYFGHSSQGKYEIIDLPNNISSLIGNIFMVFPHWMPSQIEPRLSPATWAITVELFFYLAIALGVSKTLKRTYVWLCLSLVYLVATYAFGLFWHVRYFTIPAGSLPFALGALIYYISQKQTRILLPKWLTQWPLLLFFSSTLISIITPILITKGLALWIMEILFYITMGINFLLVLSIAQGNVLFKKIPKHIDKYLGDFSYPFYLFHYQAAAIASLIIFGEIILFKNNISLMNITLTFCVLIALSAVTIRYIDRPIEKLKSIRKSKIIK